MDVEARGSISVLLKGRLRHAVMDFDEGTPVAPFSVGTDASWRVDGPGVESVHLFLYFNGRTLFASAAPVADPPRLGKARLEATWTPLSPHCQLVFGGARMHVSGGITAPGGCLALAQAKLDLPEAAPDWGAETILAFPEMDLPAPAAKESAAVSPKSLPGGVPSAGPPGDAGRQAGGIHAQPSVRQSSVGRRRVAVARTGAARTLAKWSPMRKIGLVLAPVALLLAFRPDLLTRFAGRVADEPHRAGRPRLALAKTNGGAAPAGPEPAGPERPSLQPFVFASPPSRLSASPPSRLSSSSSPPRLPVASAAPPSALPASPAMGAALVLPAAGTVARPTHGGISERAAVDAVAAGSFDEAATIYESLAAQHPSSMMFREAARLSRRRAMQVDGSDEGSR